MSNTKPLGDPGFHRHYPATQAISLREIRSEYRFEPKSPKEVTVYKVDKGLLIDNDEKCDWLLLNFTDNQGFFIELKGTNLGKALDQLNATLDKLAAKLRGSMSGVRLYCRIVVKKVGQPDIPNRERKRLERRIESFGGTLEVQSQKFIERIS
jgi:hypothetical protein